MLRTFLTQLHKLSPARMQHNSLPLITDKVDDTIEKIDLDIALNKQESHLLKELLVRACETSNTTTLLIKNHQTGRFDAFNSAILDCDFDSNTLFLDAPTGTNYHSLFNYKDKKNTILIEIKTKNGRFCITGHIHNLLRSIGNHVEIHFLATRYEHTTEKRRLSRLVFHHSTTPKATLQVDGGKNLTMDLADISAQGARCILAGHKQTHHLHTRQFEAPFLVTLNCQFNDNFTLSIKAQVIYLNYHRAPYAHNVVRLVFLDDEEQQLSALNTFIDFALAHSPTLVA